MNTLLKPSIAVIAITCSFAFQANAQDVCFVEYTGDQTTDFSSADASAIQSAINAASENSTVKIAGTCKGTYSMNGAAEKVTVNIKKKIKLEGGHTPNDWQADPDSRTYPTVIESSASRGDPGRVIYVAADATLDYLTITKGFLGPNASNQNGAGIYADGASVTLNYTTVSDNLAWGYGAGLYLTVSRSYIKHSTIDNNTVEGKGAAVYFDSGKLEIYQSTISENNTQYRSGTLYLNSGGIFIKHSTIKNREGIILGDGDLTLYLYSSIVSGSNSLSDDCYAYGGTLIDEGYNLIQDGSCISNFTSMSGDPDLGALTDNGGYTMTRALSDASIALDASNCEGIVTDQRGEDRSYGLRCDIGAYENNTHEVDPEDETDTDVTYFYGARVWGGDGGSEFDNMTILEQMLAVGKRLYIEEIGLRSGSRVDQVSLEYSHGVSVSHGGNGGSASSISLPSGTTLQQVDICKSYTGKHNSTTVHYIKFTLSNGATLSGGKQSDDCTTLKSNKGYPIVGFRGGSGDELDSLGIIIEQPVVSDL